MCVCVCVCIMMCIFMQFITIAGIWYDKYQGGRTPIAQPVPVRLRIPVPVPVPVLQYQTSDSVEP